MGHFTINADPDAIDAAGNGLTELGNHMTTKAGEIRGYIGSLPPDEWSGGARTAISQESDGLARELAKFGPMFAAAGQALKTLGTTVRTAKDTTLPSINNRWDGAESTCQSAKSKANTAYGHELHEINSDPSTSGQLKKVMRQDALDSRNLAHSDADSARSTTQGKLQGEFDQLQRDLEQAFKTASASLTENCVIAVPDKTVSDFLSHGGSGAMPSWTGADGVVFPPELGAQKALKNDLQLLDRRDQVLDGEKVAADLEAWKNDGSKPPKDLPPEVKALLAEHANDPYFGQTVATKLGPDGIVDIMQKAKGLTEAGQPSYAVDDETAEKKRLAGIQDQIASTLGAAVASGSRAPGGLPGYAKRIIERNGRVAGYLFKYADQQNLAFGGDFMHEAGVALQTAETPDPAHWQQLYRDDLYKFGNSTSVDDDKDPTLWFLRAADNSIESAQAVMGDRNLLQYFIADQPDWGGRDDQAGNVLRVATIDAARLPVPPGTRPEDSQAWKAAQISSNALDVAGQGKAPLDGVKEELGGIIALYLPDVDRAYANPDLGGPGVFDHTKDGWPVGTRPEDGWPQFGIKLDDDDLRDVLGDIAGNKTAVDVIGRSTAAYNQIRMDRGADAARGWDPKNGSSPFVIAGQDSAQLQGFLVDSIAHGNIEDAKDLEEKRKRIATAFLLPLSLASNAVPEGGKALEPLVDAVVGKISDEVAGGVSEGAVDFATDQAQTDWDQARQRLEMQALTSAYKTGQVPEQVHWPYDPMTKDWKTPDQLTPEERTRLLQQIQGAPGPTGDAVRAIENGYDNYTAKYQK